MKEIEIRPIKMTYINNIYNWLGFLPQPLVKTIRGFEVATSELENLLKGIKSPVGERTAKNEKQYPLVSLLGCPVYAYQLRYIIKELKNKNKELFVTLRPASPGNGGRKLVVVGRLAPHIPNYAYTPKSISTSTFLPARKGTELPDVDLQLQGWPLPVVEVLLLTPPFNKTIQPILL